MDFLTITPGHIERLPQADIGSDAAHLFDKRQIDAINAALGAGRPLLVRGEPGIGKSQLARAAAQALERTFLPFVTDARTEFRDLLWSFDAVARLADAQAIPAGAENTNLPVEEYLKPGVLWRAFSRRTAACQAKKAKQPLPDETYPEENGSVVLIDEIDKADTDVPNGLLEALGAGRFSVRDRQEPIEATDTPPLIVITTNEERALPDAFIRRCLVLHLSLSTEVEPAKEKFIEIGKAHFQDQLPPEILELAADMVAKERNIADKNHWLPLPGQAEYIDLLRSVLSQSEDKNADQRALLNTISEFVLKKNPAAVSQRQPSSYR